MKRLSAYLAALLLLIAPVFSAAEPHHVNLAKDGERWSFYIDGKPFYVNGASTHMFFAEIVPFGANTVRRYTLKDNKRTRELLDLVAENGLMLHAGLGFKQVRSGYYDADPEKAIREQEENILHVVETFKDHPAILCWSIGNEFEIAHQNEPLIAQYESIQRITEKNP